MKSTDTKGFSLLETVVYVGLLGAMAIFVSNSLLQMTSTYQRVVAEREALSGARMLLETITRNIAEAQEVYEPTSRFDSDAGQLSLVTVSEVQPEHTTAYVDFWQDNGVLLMRAEGSATTTLSSPAVRVSKLRFEHVTQGSGREAVRMLMRVDVPDLRFSASATLAVTVALRGNY